jgi:hypothetical protein
MNDATRKTISIVCLVFTIVWFVVLAIFESRYLIGVLRAEATFRAAMGIVYEEQIEGINFIILLVYLIPGLFALVMYRRFKQSY